MWHLFSQENNRIIYRVSINYRRISLCHNLSRKYSNSCPLHTVNVTFGMVLWLLLPSRGKAKTSVGGKWLLHRPSVVGVSWNLRDVTVLWRFKRVPKAIWTSWSLMKLQTFLIQMVATSCIFVQYLWKYGFAKYSVNLSSPLQHHYMFRVLTAPIIGSIINCSSRTLAHHTVMYKNFWIEIRNEEGSFHYW
jgi:hypothetical protein